MYLGEICCPWFYSIPVIVQQLYLIFFHPFWRFKGCSAAAAASLPQSKCYFLPWITCRKQGFGWPVTQTAKVQVGRGCGEKPCWARAGIIKSLTWLSTNIAPLCFISLRKAVGRWLSLTQAVLNSALCASDMRKGLISSSGCPVTGQLHPHGIKAMSIRLAFLWISSHNERFLRGAHKTEITREAPTEIHTAFAQTLQCLEFFLKHQPWWYGSRWWDGTSFEIHEVHRASSQLWGQSKSPKAQRAHHNCFKHQLTFPYTSEGTSLWCWSCGISSTVWLAGTMTWMYPRLPERQWHSLQQLPAFTEYLFWRFSYLAVIWLNFKQKLSWKGASRCVSQYLALVVATVSTNALRKTPVQP